jgi:hypothetical protein
MIQKLLACDDICVFYTLGSIRGSSCFWSQTGLKSSLHPVLQDSISYTGTHVVFGS